MKSFLGGMLAAAGIAALAVGVLAAAEVLLHSSSRRPRRKRQPEPDTTTPAMPDAEAPVAELVTPLVPKTDAARNFSIKRTKSEVGYVYWILEGYGKYKCFILCDSWDEAVEQAKAKLAEIDGAEMPQAMAASA